MYSFTGFKASSIYTNGILTIVLFHQILVMLVKYMSSIWN